MKRWMTQLVCASLAVPTLILTVGVIWAEQGSTTGRVVSTNPALRVRVVDNTKKTASSTTMVFEHGVDTKVTLGSDDIRVADLENGWEINVGWDQKDDDAKSKTAKNRNPMVANQIRVVTMTTTITFEGFESDAVKIAMDEQAAGSSSTAKAVTIAAKGATNPSITNKPKLKKVKAKLHPKAKFFSDGNEITRSEAEKLAGHKAEAEIIDDGKPQPLIYKLTFRGVN